MQPTSPHLVIAALATLVAGCASLGGETSRLELQSEKLMVLTAEQKAARDRTGKYADPDAVQAAQAVALLAAGIGCLVQQVGRDEGCSSTDVAIYAVPAVLAHAEIGDGTRTDAAEAANVSRRLEIAREQLTVAQQSRQLAKTVVAESIASLEQTKAGVAAGTVPPDRLKAARAEARADVEQIRTAASIMGAGANSLTPGRFAPNATRMKGLQTIQSNLTDEQSKTTALYDALVAAINRSAP